MKHSTWQHRSVWFALTLLGNGCMWTSSFDGLRGGVRDAGEDIAAPDSPDGGADAGSTGCRSSASQFCADFDTGEATGGWNDFERTAGDGGRDPATYVSPPFSFAVSTAPIALGVPAAEVFLLREFPSPARSVRVSFGLRVDVVPPDNSRGEVLDVRFQGAGIDYHLYVTLRSGVDALTEYTNPVESGTALVDHPLSSAVPRAEWTTITLDVDLAARSAVLRVGPKIVAAVAIRPPWTSGAVLLRVGLAASPPAGAYAAHFDDVRFDQN